MARVPVGDGGGEQVEPGDTVGLVLAGAVAQLAEAVEEEGALEDVMRLALVEPDLRAALQVTIGQPVEDEERALDPPDLAQSPHRSKNGQRAERKVDGVPAHGLTLLAMRLMVAR